MRLCGSKHTAHWVVWHVPSCRQLVSVVWVDDDTHQYAQHTGKRLGLLWSEIVTYQAKKIEIHTEQALVLIDPIEDVDSSQVLTREQELQHV